MIKSKIAAVAAAVLVLAGVASTGIGFAAAASHSKPKPAYAPPGYSGPSDPKLLACEHAQKVCDPRASSWKVIMAQPFSHPMRAGALVITPVRAVALARSMVRASPNAPVSGVMMTGAQAIALFKIDRGANVDESRPVWVITIQMDIKPDSVTPMPVRHYYSAIIDAGSGILTDDCIGCQWVAGGKPVPAVATGG